MAQQTAMQQRAKDPLESLVSLVESPQLKIQIMRALPKQLSLDRFMRIAVTVLRTRPDLAACEPLSIIGSIVEASQLGLELDPVLGHGYLVPFYSKDERRKRAIFIPGYRGYVHLMRNSGLVHNVNSELVLQGEKIELELGSQRSFKHTPVIELDRLDPKLWLGAYSTVTFFQGEPDFEFMNCTAILAIKARSLAKNKDGDNVGPWKTDEAEMWRKTTIRRIAKRMPLSPTTLPAITAAERDELRELVPGYVEAEKLAPALEDLPPVQDSITVSSTPEPEQKPVGAEPAKAEPVNGTQRVTEPAKTPEPEPEKKKAAPAPEKAKPATKPAAGANQAGKKKAAPPPAAHVPEFLSPGQQKSIRNYLINERGHTEADLLNMLGAHGFEKLELVPRSEFQRIWSACVQMPK